MDQSPFDNINTLMVEKATLLERLETIRRDGHKGEGAHSTPEIHQRYNEIIDTLNRLNSITRYDPVDKLPSELFSTILYEALATPVPHSNKYYFNFEWCLLLTLVSIRWRNFILQTPLLWTSIFVNPKIPDFQARIELCLALSRGLPLQLYVTFPLQGWDEALQRLVGHRERIQGISLFWSTLWLTPTNTFAYKMVFEVIDGLLPLPNLQRVYVSSEPIRDSGDIAHHLLEQCPSLQEISGFSIRRHLLSFDCVRQIRSATITVDFDSFLPLQHYMPNLTNVKLESYAIKSSSVDSGRTITEAQGTLTPLKWQHLICAHPQLQNILPLIQRLQDLILLELTGRIPLLFGLLTHLSEFSRLKSLIMALDISDYKPETPSSLSLIQINNSITSLKLTFHHVDKNRSTFLHYSQINLGHLPDALIKSMPGLEQLDLAMNTLPPLYKLYGKGAFPRLSKLYLQTSYGLRLEHPNELASSLRSVHFLCSSKFLSGLSSPNVDQLRFEMFTFPKKSEIIQTITNQNWPALRSLTIFEEYFTGEQFWLPRLRELTVQVGPYPHVLRFRRYQNTTRLCKVLAIDPGALPSLEKLTLHGPPQWDILLLMIKRRHITTIKNITPLKSLTITARCPKELIVPIVELLQGKLPNELSLHDLSINGISEIMQDLSMYV
jgi:hypothetical protein